MLTLGACPAGEAPQGTRAQPRSSRQTVREWRAAETPERHAQRHHSSGVPGSEVPGSAAHAVLIHLRVSVVSVRRAGDAREEKAGRQAHTHASALAPFGAWNIANMFWAVLNTIACDVRLR